MDQTIPDLIDRLRGAALCWCEATGRTLGALSSQVLNHGSFFERLGGKRPSATTDTLRKFAVFLADPANWPEPPAGMLHVLPEAVCSFVHINGITATACPQSPDNPCHPIGAAPALSGAVRSVASCPPGEAADIAPAAASASPHTGAAAGEAVAQP